MTCKNQESGKFTNYTIDEIKDYLAELKKLITDGQYIVSQREENDAFAFEISFHKRNRLITYLFR